MKAINLTYYVDDYTLLTGKLLGFINRAQFYRLFNDPVKFARKIGSGDVKSLDVISKVADYKKHRLVFSTDVKGVRHLLVTGEIIEKNTTFVKSVMSLNLVDAHNNFIYIDEEGA